MRQCYECVYFFCFSHVCLCPRKNEAYGRPSGTRIRTETESPACSFFVDIDEVTEE